MNMPGVGNPFVNLPPKIQTIVDSGLRIFELRLTEPFDNVQRLFGFHDARTVEDTFPGSTRLRYRTRWFTGDTAYIEFRPSAKNGICTGWCPDDAYWHNRVQMAGLLPFNRINIMRMHTREGVIPGKTASEYIQCVWDVCFEWHIVKKGIERQPYILQRFKTRHEADAALLKLHEEIKDEDAAERKKIWVMMGKSEPIERLVAKYRSAWTKSNEFAHEVVPQIQELINTRTRGMAQSVNAVQMLLDAAATMTPEQKEQMRKILAPDLPSIGLNTSTAVSAEDEEDLEKMAIGKLRAIAKAKGINSKDKKAADIRAEIRAKVEQEKEELAKKAAPTATATMEPLAIGQNYPEFEEDADDEGPEVV